MNTEPTSLHDAYAAYVERKASKGKPAYPFDRWVRAGRPTIPNDERLVPHTIRLTPEESAKLRVLGRPWLAPKLKRIPSPTN